MLLKYMLDTNIASFIIKGKSPKLELKFYALPLTTMCISMITRAELLYGVAKMPQATRLKSQVTYFLANIQTLEWDIHASNHYGIVRADLEKRGQVIGSLDMLIASHALAENLIIITNNMDEFKRVNALKFEDWTL